MVLLLVIIVAVVTLVVLLHYECLYRLTLLMPTLRIKYRYRLVMGVFGALLAHVVEVLIFGFAYYYMHG